MELQPWEWWSVACVYCSRWDRRRGILPGETSTLVKYIQAHLQRRPVKSHVGTTRAAKWVVPKLARCAPTRGLTLERRHDM